MRDLTPVGLSKDGKRLVLVSAAGEEFAVTVDTRLRAALRGENARLGQLEMKMESALRPRDIQARIRSGESPEEVAAAAQTTVDAIMGFATPVLAERAHVAQTAQKASVRRRSNEASSAARTLGDAAADFFARHHLHDEDVEWDAWRRQDGRWALVVEYAVSGSSRRAEFIHDLPGRYVVADNDEARVLTGELSPPSAAPAAGREGGAPRRLSTVPSSPAAPAPGSQDELPLGDDAIEMVRDREEVAPAPAEPGDDTADADWITTADSAPESEAPEPVARVADPDDELIEPVPAEEPEPEPEPAAEEEPAKPSKRKGRSSVPSWDEIMFGGGKD